MNILQVLPELKSGGVERGAVDLAKYLRRHGHKSIVVSAGGPLVADLTAAGVTHYALPVQKKSFFSVLYSIRMLAKIVQLEQIDILHARSRVPAIISFFVSRRTQVPFITTCHGFYSRHWASRAMGWGKLVIVGSRIIGKRMRDDFGVPHERIRLVPRGVNLEEFKYQEHSGRSSPQPVVGLVGRLTPIKGHPTFLKAMARVARVVPGVKIQIVGDAPKPQYKEELLALVRNLGLSACTEFLGTRYDVGDLMSKMSVLVLPSVGEEAFGRVLIEAGACGVPVVATRVGGIVDVVDHEKDGLLVPSNDPRLLAEAILRLLKDPALAKRLSVALRSKVEKQFTLDQMFDKTLDVYREVAARKKILVIKISAHGDVILSIPSIRALKEKYPQARLTVLVGKKSREVIRNCPYVDDVIVYEGNHRIKLWSLIALARVLAKESFDIVVDLQNNRASHFLSYFCGSPTRAGYNNHKWSFFLNRKVKESNEAMPPIEHQFQVLKQIGLDPLDKRLELWTNRREEEKVAAFLEAQWISPRQVLVGMNPGSSLRWPTKQWPLENFAKLCDELAKRNIRVVITGSKDDEPAAQELLAMTRNHPVNAVGKTSITELIALIRRCQVFISSDSAPMHIAASLGIPLIALFGPTDPKRHLVPPAHYQVFWKQVHCSPCYLRSCPVGHLCMNKITPQEVLDAVIYFAGLNHSERAMDHGLGVPALAPHEKK